MLTFWGLITESDVDAYVSTLLLPSYMSHLQRQPFRFGRPRAAADRQSLLITYHGEGRVEEYEIDAKRHAIGLLKSLCPGIRLEALRIPDAETIWNWSGDYGRDANDSVSMRLYFDPVPQSLPPETVDRFEPARCHVSVSRMEMFIGRPVLERYFAAWIDYLEGTGAGSMPELEAMAGGVRFYGARLGGELSLQDDEMFRDLLRFCGLARSLEEVSGNVRYDMDHAETEIDEDGFRFRLVPGGTAVNGAL